MGREYQELYVWRMAMDLAEAVYLLVREFRKAERLSLVLTIAGALQPL